MIENFSQQVYLMKEKSLPIQTDWIDITVNTQRVCHAINKSAEDSAIVNLADIVQMYYHDFTENRKVKVNLKLT